MRATLLIFIFFVFSISNHVKAQTVYVKAGASLSSLQYSLNGKNQSANTITNFHLGVGITTGISSKFAFQYGINYSKLHGDPANSTDFIQGIASLKYFPNRKIDFNLGVYGGLKLSGDPIYQTDFGLCPGVETFITKEFGIGLSYFYGLDDISLDNGRTRALLIGLIFRIKSKQLEEDGF